MSSFNPNAPASGSFTGGQERRFKREGSAEEKGKGWEEREVRPRDGWLEEDSYDVNMGFPRYGGKQRRQPVDVGRWVEDGRVDDRELAPQGPAPAPWDPALAPLMPAADQEQEVRRWHKATAIGTDPAYQKQLQRDAQRRALFCRGCGGRHKQWDCPTRPVCQRCHKEGHRRETCLVPERDRRTERSRRGNFGFNLRQARGPDRQEVKEEENARRRRSAAPALKEEEDEDDRRRKAILRLTNEEEEAWRERAILQLEEENARRRLAIRQLEEEEEEVRLRRESREASRQGEAEEARERLAAGGRRPITYAEPFRQLRAFRSGVQEPLPPRAATPSPEGPPLNAPREPRALARLGQQGGSSNARTNPAELSRAQKWRT